MPLLISMTIAGSIPLLLCLLLWIIQKNSFDSILGIRLLKVSIFFFLIPIQLIRHILPAEVVNDIYYSNRIERLEPIIIDAEGKLQVAYKGHILLIPFWLIFLAAIGCVAMILFSIYEIVKYRRVLKGLLCDVDSNASSAKGNLVILEKSGMNIPFSIGFFHSCIIIPDNLEDDFCKKVILEHEACHIRNHDAICKFLCLIALCFHWYNPLAWFLLPLYSIVSECVCDWKVTRSLFQNEKREYARLIIEFSSGSEPLPAIWKNNFSNAKFNIKRRLTFIMEDKKNHFNNRVKTGIMILLCIFAGSTTIFAYEPLEESYVTSDPEQDASMVFIPDGYYSSEYFPYEELDFSKSDRIFVADDGTQIPIIENGKRASCNHSFQMGTLYENHRLDGKGGCSFDKYEVSMCSNCYYVKSKTFLNTVSLSECPHK